jgi:glycosyltransferase involved in cell wall biosynthesis
MRLGAGGALRHASGMHYTSHEEQRLAELSVPGLPAGHIVPLGVADDLFTEASDPSGSDHLGSDHPGSDLQRSDPSGSDPKGPEHAGPYVLALSRIDAKKGIDILIRAWHQLAVAGGLGGWSLRIAGDGDDRYMNEMRALAAAGAGSATIVFTGWVDGVDRRALLRHAGLFALPSHQENFGFALAEAMASGVPAMVSPGVNLAADIVAAGAGWVSAREHFAEALGAALASPAICRERGRHARAYAEQFRWPQVGVRLLEIYGTMSAANPHPRRVASGIAPPVDGVGVCS